MKRRDVVPALVFLLACLFLLWFGRSRIERDTEYLHRVERVER